jgi:hypothetical protein
MQSASTELNLTTRYADNLAKFTEKLEAQRFSLILPPAKRRQKKQRASSIPRPI